MIDYPSTPTVDQVDDYHGHRVADPYRWLEDDHAPETAAWVAAQNALTRSWIDAVPQRDDLRAAVRDRWDIPRRGAPWRRGGWWFQLRNTGLQNQDVLWTAPRRRGGAAATDAGDGPNTGTAADVPPGDPAWRVLIDPNTMSEAGTVALSGLAASFDGGLVAYATSEAGSDWLTWHVRDVATGRDHPDELRWSKFSPAAWTADGAGFFYAAYDAPAVGETFTGTNRNQRLWYHRLGTVQDEDALVYARPDQPEWGFPPSTSADGRWLIVYVWQGTEPRNRVYVARLDDGVPTTLVPLLDDFDAAYDPIGVVGDRLLLRTDHGAPRGRVVSVPLPAGAGHDGNSPRLTEIVPEGSGTLETVVLAGGDRPSDALVGVVLEDASSRLRRWRLDSAGAPAGPAADLPLPDLGTVGAVTARHDSPVVHATVTTFTTPPQVHRFDVRTGARTSVFVPRSSGAGTGAGAPERGEPVTEQVWFCSADGTRVPMFIVHRGDVDPSGGPRPTILYGYGGFNIAITPAYRPAWAAWVERGGVLAVPNLRGGGEFGRDWHDAGRLARKQNVFDDAIAAAEHLIAAGWTTPAQLAITGGSNGGLLVGACMTQRPDLFGAAVPEVGVLDMLRFHRFTIGWGWQSDYGNPDDPDDFAVLHAYSPLHRLRSGMRYPATLVTTGDHDDRVVPGHSFKFAAALQAAQGGDAPVLIRIETDAGHGAGKPAAKAVDERADVLAFLVATVGDPAAVPRAG